ncbi:MAG TPA: hypothetical protein VGF34_17010 [Stellaceae bacterium]|jgi:hypothetical protein
MAGPAILKFGTLVEMGGRRRSWIGLTKPPLQQSGDIVIGRLCNSLAELEQTIEQLHAELDAVLVAARTALSPYSTAGRMKKSPAEAGLSPELLLGCPPVVGLLLIIQMPGSSDERPVTLFFSPNRFLPFAS